MNEAADIASILPAIVALSLWWAFLSTLDMLFGQHPPGATDQPPARLPEGDVPPVAHDPQPGGLRDLDPEFDAKGFLAGAQRAYESVLDAYAANDLETLQRLLSAEVLEVFGEACASRMATSTRTASTTSCACGSRACKPAATCARARATRRRSGRRRPGATRSSGRAKRCATPSSSACPSAGRPA